MKQSANTAKLPSTPRGQAKAVVDTLGSRISTGVYKEGETLPIEHVLASSLGVGRNALREAVKVLSGKGLIASATRSGTKVRPKEFWNMLDPQVLGWHSNPDTASAEFMLDLVEIRGLIEPKASELAAIRATRSDIAEILDAFDEMKNNANDLSARIEADIKFHSAILKASHNSMLSHFKEATSAYLRAHAKLGEQQSIDVVDKDLGLHQNLALAIASGKAQLAYDATVAVLNSNKSHFDNVSTD